MPLVSVVIPSYNYGKYIGQSISSVLCQTFTDFELIIIDDGSKDNTREVVSQFKDKRLRYHYQYNSGLSAARNSGVNLSAGKYIAFLDADDLWLPKKLELQVPLIEQSEMIGLVYGGYQVFGEDIASTLDRNPIIHNSNWLHYLVLGNYVSGSATTSLIRRDCFLKVGLFDEKLKSAEDWDMWLRIAMYYEFRAITTSIAKIRIHTSNMTSDVNLMDTGFQAVLDKFFRRSDLPSDIYTMEKKARAKAKIAASVFALRREKFDVARHLSSESLSFYKYYLDAYVLILKSIVHKKF